MQRKYLEFSRSFCFVLAFIFAAFGLLSWLGAKHTNTQSIKLLNTATDSSAPRTEPVTSEFRFATVGDFDYNNTTRSVLDVIAREKTDFTIALGDLSYDKTPSEREWCDLVTSKLGKKYPFQLVAGNHDVGEQGNKASIDRFASCLPNKMPDTEGVYAQEYFFDYNKIARIITISPKLTINKRDYVYTKGSESYVWLSDTIDDARRQNLDWVVVAMHKNCITIGEKSCEIGTDLLDLLAQKKIDLVLQGHEHGYMRSQQLSLGDDCTSLQPKGFNENCVTNSTQNTYKKGSGPILVIVGTGGAELRPIYADSSDSGYFADYSGSNVDPTYGPLIVNLSKTTMKADFVGTDGTTHDSFKIE